MGAEQGVLYLASPWTFGEMRSPGEMGAKNWPSRSQGPHAARIKILRNVGGTARAKSTHSLRSEAVDISARK